MAWVTVLATVALVAVAWVGGGSDPSSLPKLTVLWAGVAIALGLYGAWLIASRAPVPVPWVVAPVAFLVVISAAATVRSVSLPWSIFGRVGRYAGLLTLVSVVVLAALIVGLTWSRTRRLDALLVALVATGVAEALVVGLDRVGVHVLPQGLRESSDYAAGLLGNSNFTGAHLAITLPALVLLARRTRSVTMRTALVVAVLLQVVALGLSGSRGALIAGLVGIAVFGLLGRSVLPRSITLPCVGLSIVAVLFVGVLVVAQWRGSGLGVASSGPLRSSTLVSRVDYWRGAVEAIQARPFLGWGPDTFELVFPPYAPAGTNRVEGGVVKGPGGDRTDEGLSVVDEPHNILLEVGAGSGLLGTAAWLSTVVVALAFAIRGASALEAHHRGLLAAFTGGFAAYLVQGTFSIDVVPLLALGWIMIGAMTSLADPRIRAMRDSTEVDARLDRAFDRQPAILDLVAMAAVVTLAIVVVVLAFRPIAADRRMAELSKSQSAPEVLVPALDEALRLDPFNSDLQSRASTIAATLAASATGADRDTLLAYALDRVDRALELAPRDIRYLRSKGAILRRQGEVGDVGRFAAGDAVYGQLTEHDPYNSAAFIDRARLLVAWWQATGNNMYADQARDALGRAEALDQPLAKGWYLIGKARFALGDRDAAIAATQRALQLQPDYPEAQALLSRLMASR